MNVHSYAMLMLRAWRARRVVNGLSGLTKRVALSFCYASKGKGVHPDLSV